MTRFAPSPTGYLHLGHAFAALTAARLGERFLVRIEDIDMTRVRPEFETAIFEDLAWLGLRWETPVLRQSERFGAYRNALADLAARALIYPCFCTRKDIAEEIERAGEAPHGPEGPLYPGTCKNLTEIEQRSRKNAGLPFAWRLDAAKAAASVGRLTFMEAGAGPAGQRGVIDVDPGLHGDVVLARKETPASYHLSVVIDDSFQGVNLVTRGNDLFSATHVQRLLQAVLGLPAPHYAHHRLILDAQGRKFSKRDQAVTMKTLRESGITPDEVRRRVGFG